jgi:hypothetical protein
VGVEGNADFLPTLISLGPFNQAHTAFIKKKKKKERKKEKRKKGRLQLRPYEKPYKETTTPQQRFGMGSRGGVWKG